MNAGIKAIEDKLAQNMRAIEEESHIIFALEARIENMMCTLEKERGSIVNLIREREELINAFIKLRQPRFETCPTCLGSRVVDVFDGDTVSQYPCPTCKAKGRLEVEY